MNHYARKTRRLSSRYPGTCLQPAAGKTYQQTELLLSLTPEQECDRHPVARQDPAWDDPDPPIRVAPEHSPPLPFNYPDPIGNHLIDVSSDTAAAGNTDNSVREHVYSVTQQIAPEHSHWIEVYWVARGYKKHLYYRYCWMVGRKINRVHLPGGHIHKKESIACRQAVSDALASGLTPQDIKKLIQDIRNSSN